MKLPHRRQFLHLAAGAAVLPTVSHFAAAQTRLPQSKTGTRLITLGTAGGPLPRKDRAQSSSLLVINGTLYLIDAGDGVTRRIVQAGYDFRQVGKIFITHLHSDHTAGLATLLVSTWEFQRPDPVDIYGGGVERLVKGAIDYLTANAEIQWVSGKKRPMADAFRGHDVVPGVVFQDANVKVTAVENTHFNFPEGSPPYGKYRSYSYRFDTPERAIVFTGDTGPSEKLTELARDADVLVTEGGSALDVIETLKRNGVWQAKTPEEQAGFIQHMKEEHLTPEDIGKMAANARVKTVVLTHLAATVLPDDDYQRNVDEVKKHFTGQVLVAKDLMELG